VQVARCLHKHQPRLSRGSSTISTGGPAADQLTYRACHWHISYYISWTPQQLFNWTSGPSTATHVAIAKFLRRSNQLLRTVAQFLLHDSSVTIFSKPGSPVPVVKIDRAYGLPVLWMTTVKIIFFLHFISNSCARQHNICVAWCSAAESRLFLPSVLC
jgi:hypothetical protein